MKLPQKEAEVMYTGSSERKSFQIIKKEHYYIIRYEVDGSVLEAEVFNRFGAAVSRGMRYIGKLELR